MRFHSTRKLVEQTSIGGDFLLGNRPTRVTGLLPRSAAAVLQHQHTADQDENEAGQNGAPASCEGSRTPSRTEKQRVSFLAMMQQRWSNGKGKGKGKGQKGQPHRDKEGAARAAAAAQSAGK